MPCYDERNSPSYIYENEVRPLEAKIKKLEAVLCGIFTQRSQPQYNGAGIKVILDQLDYNEMGVSRKWIEDWWRKHQIEDRERIKRKQAQRQAAHDRKKNQLMEAEALVLRLKKELKE